MEWRDAPTTHRKSAHISALGLHRDASRGRTHIVLQFVRYTPEVSKDPRFKFTSVATGVFRIKDALKMIEAATMNLDPGEGTFFIQEVINDTEHAGRSSTDPVHIPILELTFGKDISPAWLSGNATNNVGLRAHPYNPDWRKTMNGTGVAPEPLVLVKEMNAEDVEHVFD
ncbi:hypothetical protein PENSPDRAFT_692540 [Peniophora sp. CONT]|nr:hypothetical protein PENSPDRAFT_692540 [Peniophora sp. CONT]